MGQVVWIISSSPLLGIYNITIPLHLMNGPGVGLETPTVTATVYDKAGNSQSQSMSTPYIINTQTIFNPFKLQGLTVKYQLNE